ncbi:MAG TPA: DUF305 domain-containing protein [Micromonosporaceae bacterium]
MMNKPYLRLAIVMGLSLLTMYPLTMVMVRRPDDFTLNLSNAYMALVMVAPMGVFMLFVMSMMFRNRVLNIALYAAFAALFVGAFWFARLQTGLGDEQMMRSMVPHHSRAILVCQESNLSDPEVIELCDQIVRSQEEEIAQMRRLLERY